MWRYAIFLWLHNQETPLACSFQSSATRNPANPAWLPARWRQRGLAWEAEQECENKGHEGA